EPDLFDGANDRDGNSYNAFFYTARGGLQIIDQYGDNSGGGGQGDDRIDGVEFLNIRFTTVFGAEARIEAQFVEDEGGVEAGAIRGDDLRNDWLMGTRGDEVFTGRGNPDIIFTGAGDDEVYGGTGSDHIHASRGSNYLSGGSSGDFYYWNRDFLASNVIEDDNTSEGDIVVADFDVADLNRAVADSETDNLVLGFAKASDLSTETSTFILRNQFQPEDEDDPSENDRYDIEFIRFAGKQFILQQDAPGDGGDGDDFIAMSESGGDRVKAGAGDDVVFGNGGADNLKGQAGMDLLVGGALRDKLFGGGGDDMLRGGAMGDRLVGGKGADTADYRTSDEGVRVDLNAKRQKGGDAARDRLKTIENVVGSEQNDQLRGDSGANALSGRAGKDVLLGRGGGDELMLGAGGDRAKGGGGNDDIWGGAGRDILRGDGGADEIWTGAGRDRAWGGAGDDALWGGRGQDRLWGNAGDDTFHGSAGRDIYYVGPGDDRIRGYDIDQDRIAFSGPDQPSRFGDLDISERGSNVIVRWDGGSVRIDDTDESQITRSDFIF
ncbi:MAG: calcium-binding protein, partial [Pseudomonadota bacterium]